MIYTKIRLIASNLQMRCGAFQALKIGPNVGACV